MSSWRERKVECWFAYNGVRYAVSEQNWWLAVQRLPLVTRDGSQFGFRTLDGGYITLWDTVGLTGAVEESWVEHDEAADR
ncbi:MAG: hypothetical protein BGO38_06890 [Cellulomonas sp. 73-145]|uniref:hypothetical protein n=1 Tax=Cellulomonas sp. 73-145 TaxID=1895739 RepID=UPI00092749B3|nr:hypothetical protein [Cellulomonas sp. 73-145]MBN9325944.1 hypothetical protein [Cellulomonas sp.]OJV57942.1 MAG: hypothetical protein BGO38_06890 [Cellulomonas sp. 73-145]